MPPQKPYRSFSGDAKKNRPKNAPPVFTYTPKAKKTSGYISPVPNLVKVDRLDQGQDLQGQVGSNVVAIGNARIDYVGPASGFGQMVIYTLTSGKAAGTRIYVGHAQPVSSLKVGQTINQGSPVATLLASGLGNAAGLPGWVEVGIAHPDQNRPMYGSAGGGGGIAFKQLLGQTLTPTEKSTVKAAQAAADAANSNLQSARAANAAALALAKQEIHYGDPWVTVERNPKTHEITFGLSIQAQPPKNALTFGGQPLTKSDLSSIWTQRYQGVYDEFTSGGKAPTPTDMVNILKMGLSSYGLRDYLSKQKGFQNSIAFTANAPGLQAVAKNILGGNAPTNIVSQAIADGWDQSTFEAALRKLPQYLQGPEYQTNLAQMKTVYQQIYGTPDANATQSISEAAGNGWSTDQFANYLRSDPAYKTSLEYQANAVSFLDAMGLLVGARPTFTPGTIGDVSGGTPVQNSPTVPGTPKPLNPELAFTPSLSAPSA